jgi:hypothetical protein
LCVAKRERHHVIVTPIQVSGVRSRARGDAAAGLAMAQPSPCGYVSIPRSVDPLGCAPTQMRWGNAEGGDVKATKGWCASLHGSVSTGMRPTRPRLGEGRENTKGPRISRPRTRQSIALAHEGVDERLGGARGVCGALHAGRHRGAESGGGRDGGHLPELGNETRRSKLGISTQTQEESAPCGSPDVAGRWPSRCYARRAWPRPPLACARCWRSRTTHTPVRAGFKPFSCSPPSRLRLGSSATGVAGGEAAQGRATARRAFHPKISKARSCGNAQGGWCGDSHSQRHGVADGSWLIPYSCRPSDDNGVRTKRFVNVAEMLAPISPPGCPPSLNVRATTWRCVGGTWPPCPRRPGGARSRAGPPRGWRHRPPRRCPWPCARRCARRPTAARPAPPPIDRGDLKALMGNDSKATAIWDEYMGRHHFSTTHLPGHCGRGAGRRGLDGDDVARVGVGAAAGVQVRSPRGPRAPLCQLLAERHACVRANTRAIQRSKSCESYNGRDFGGR